MTFEAFRAKITTVFKDGFVVDPEADPVVSFLPVEYENQPFKIPATGSWCRFSIVEGDRDNAAVGTGFQRTVGIVYVQIFSREGTGSKKARETADKIASIFDNQSIEVAAGESITMRPVSFTTVGLNEDGWYQWNVSAPFWFDAVA